MKIQFFLIIILSHTYIWACTTVYSPPYKFDPDEYIFIGKVVDHIITTGVESKHKYKGNYNGALVEIVETVYLPEKPEKYFEIYPLSLSPDCRESPYYKEYIEQFLPIGSEVRIVAKKSKIDFEIHDDSNIQLIVSPHNQFTLSINYYNIPYLKSTKESLFSYKNTLKDSTGKLTNMLADSLNIKDIELKNVLAYSVKFQKDFELRKDLYRLYSSKDDREKVRIIYRLKNFRYLGAFKLLSIITEYIQDEIIRNKLLMSLFDIREKVSPIEWIIGK